MIDRRDLTQMSFGFIPTKEEWSEADGGELVRVLDVDLFDVSVVTFPAYDNTDAAVRSAIEAQRRSSPLAQQRRADALTRFDELSKATRQFTPPPGQTRER
jgi:phage head maturation protease